MENLQNQEKKLDKNNTLRNIEILNHWNNT